MYICMCVCVQNVHIEFIAVPYDLTIVCHKCLNSKSGNYISYYG